MGPANGLSVSRFNKKDKINKNEILENLISERTIYSLNIRTDLIFLLVLRNIYNKLFLKLYVKFRFIKANELAM